MASNPLLGPCLQLFHRIKQFVLVTATPTQILPLSKDVEFSLDYPTEAEQDRQHGGGNWALLHQQADRCRRLGVPVNFIAVMMKSNFSRLADIAGIAQAYGATLRINVYQAVRTERSR